MICKFTDKNIYMYYPTSIVNFYVGLSWSWSYGSWIDNYLCNQCLLLPLTLWVWIPLRRVVLDTTLCDKVCQWLAAGWWFSLGTLVSSTNKTDCHDITEILLKVALNTITPPPFSMCYYEMILVYYHHWHGLDKFLINALLLLCFFSLSKLTSDHISDISFDDILLIAIRNSLLQKKTNQHQYTFCYIKKM